MKGPDHFDIFESHAIYRPTGRVTLPEAVQLVTAAIAYARSQGIPRLMVVTNGLTGFGVPDLTTRYLFIREWARTAAASVRLAMVARPEMIDPQKFGVVVAANAGLVADIFDSEEMALAWLLRRD